MQKRTKTSKNIEVPKHEQVQITEQTSKTETQTTDTKQEVKKKMAVDLDAIRRKLSQISGQNKSRDTLWKPARPTPGNSVEYKVRLLPFPNNEGQPFKERWFYYGIGKNSGLLAPYQFGKKDPINELIAKLREDGYEENKALLKLLYPKMRAYAPIIVRGEEDKGPKLWAFGKNVYQQILNTILNEDYGDVTDIEDGRDLTVTFSRKPTEKFDDTAIMPRVKTSPLSTDPKLAQKWIAEIPNLDDMYQLKPYEEIERIVNEWLSSGGSSETEDVGEERTSSKEKTTPMRETNKVNDDLDAAFADIIDE